MTEKFNIKNIFSKSAREVKAKQAAKNNNENAVSHQENIFEGTKINAVDNNKILDESEKYTKEKYGSPDYTENIDNIEDYTDFCEDLIEDKTTSETSDKNIVYDKPKSSLSTLKPLKTESSFYTDADGNKVELRTYKNSEGDTKKNRKITTKTVTSGNPYREVNSVETDKYGKIISETNTVENFATGIKVCERKDSEGNITETRRDRDGNIISTKCITFDGPNFKTIETDEKGNTYETTVNYQPDGVVLEDKKTTSATGKVLYYYTKTQDPSANIINETKSVFDGDGGRPYHLFIEKDMDGNITYFDEYAYSFSENLNNTKDPTSETIFVSINSSGDNCIQTETQNLRTKTFSVKKTTVEGSEILLYDENRQLISQTEFKPLESYENLFSGKSVEELIKFEKDAGSNPPGEYLTYEFIDGVKTLTSGYKIDANGKYKSYSENDKAKIRLNEQQGLDKKIGDSHQQATGDCWLLAGVNSLSYTEKGRGIIADALEYNDKGATVHTYFGDYSFSYKEIETATTEYYSEEEDGKKGKKYADGDADVVVFEMAIKQLRSDISYGIYKVKNDNFLKGRTGKVTPEEITLNGGYHSEFIYYLTGNQSTIYNKKADKKETLNRFVENRDTAALGAAFKKDVIVSDVNGKEIELHDRHAYSVKSYDGENVAIVNPWNSGEDIIISAKDFIKHTAYIQYTDLSTIEKDNGLFENDTFWLTFIANLF